MYCFKNRNLYDLKDISNTYLRQIYTLLKQKCYWTAAKTSVESKERKRGKRRRKDEEDEKKNGLTQYQPALFCSKIVLKVATPVENNIFSDIFGTAGNNQCQVFMQRNDQVPPKRNGIVRVREGYFSLVVFSYGLKTAAISFSFPKIFTCDGCV